jgi:hypothetical protein
MQLGSSSTPNEYNLGIQEFPESLKPCLLPIAVSHYPHWDTEGILHRRC